MNRSIRAPPILLMVQESRVGGTKMKDYTKNTFWTKIDERNERHYYIKLNGMMVEVDKEVYNAMFSFYRQSLRKKELKTISLDSTREGQSLYDYLCSVSDPMQEIYQEFLKQTLQETIAFLDETEQEIINGLFFNENTEAELGEKLKMSRQLIHYKKKRVLKKMRELLGDVFNDKLNE